MESDSERYLAKLDRRGKKIAKLVQLFVLCLLIGFGLWSVWEILPRKPKTEKTDYPYKSGNCYYEIRTTTPTAVEGRVYYDDTENVLKIYDGNSWATASVTGDLAWKWVQEINDYIYIASDGATSDSITFTSSAGGIDAVNRSEKVFCISKFGSDCVEEVSYLSPDDPNCLMTVTEFLYRVMFKDL